MNKQSIKPATHLLVSALEPSSSNHLKLLIKTLDSLPNCPKIILSGVFDASLLEGLENITGIPLYSPKDFSVMGFSDVLKKFGFLLKARKEMLKLAKKANLALFLDSSSFHIPLAKKIKRNFPNLKLLYYILPQVWAWKSYRAKKIEKIFDELLAILPFELNFYKNKAHYVGHPLLDSITQFKTNTHGDGIIFMPGSRRGEISRLFPLFCTLARDYFKDKKKILVVPEIFKDQDLNEIYGEELSLFEISFDARNALLKGEFAFICSGTATLEAAIIGIPFVLAYITGDLDYAILSRIIKLNCIGLANIFYQALNHEAPGYGQKRLHLELIQKECNIHNLIKAYEQIDQESFFKEAGLLKKYLAHGSAQNVAKCILKYKN